MSPAAATEKTFDKWIHRVDTRVEAIAGLSIHDLPDVPLRDWFDDNTPPTVAAQLALEEAGL